jgi:Flp pilus assembly protein TadD
MSLPARIRRRSPVPACAALALAAAAAGGCGDRPGPGREARQADDGAVGSGRPSPAEAPEAPSAATGLALLRQGDLRGAELHLAGALQTSPRDPRLLEALGTIYARTDRFRQAERSFRAALDAEPRSPGASLGLAAVLIDTGRHDEALQRLEEIRRRDPGNSAALLKLALLEVRRGRAAEGERMAHEVIERQPASAEAHYVLGLALSHRGAFAEAGAAQRRARALDPEHLGALAQLAKIEARLGHAAEARRWSEAHREALRRGRIEERVRGHRLKAVEAFNRGDYRAALEAFQSIAHEDPDDSQVHLHLGSTFIALGRMPEARQALDRSLALDPRNERALAEMGRLLAFQNRLDEAILTLRKAVAVNPQFPEPHYYLAGIHLARGEAAEARHERAIYERLRSRSPGGSPLEVLPDPAPERGP